MNDENTETKGTPYERFEALDGVYELHSVTPALAKKHNLDLGGRKKLRELKAISPKYRFFMVTSDRLKQLFDEKLPNIDISSKRIDDLQEELQDGRFEPINASIHLDNDLYLMNGQTRVLAGYLERVALLLDVIPGTYPDAMKTQDGGKRLSTVVQACRKHKPILEAEYPTSAPIVQQVYKDMGAIIMQLDKPLLSNKGRRNTDDIISLVSAYAPELLDVTQNLRKAPTGLLNARTRAGFFKAAISKEIKPLVLSHCMDVFINRAYPPAKKYGLMVKLREAIRAICDKNCTGSGKTRGQRHSERAVFALTLKALDAVARKDLSVKIKPFDAWTTPGQIRCEELFQLFPIPDHRIPDGIKIKKGSLNRKACDMADKD